MKISVADYYPFGMTMPGREYKIDLYRFGFNGKEKDDEWHGSTGSTYDYGFRIYDARVARFLSVDPLTKSYPWYTPYQFAGNKPIAAIDLDGLEEYIVNGAGEIYPYPMEKADATSVAGHSQQLPEGWSPYIPPIAERESFLSFTDANDFKIILSTITDDVPTDIDGNEIGMSDFLWAAGGLFIPGVAGSTVKKIGGEIVESIASKYSNAKHLANKDISWKKVVEGTKSGPAKFHPDINADEITFEAWEKGTNVTNGKDWKVYKSDDNIGAYKGKETSYMRVERTKVDGKNVLHSHPINEQQFKKLTKK